MVPVLISIVVLLAVAAWIVAVVSLFSAIALVPRGQRISALFASGFWRFEKLRALGGPGVDTHIRRYGYAFAAFFMAIALGMVLGVVANVTAHNAKTAARLPDPSATLPSAVLES